MIDLDGTIVNSMPALKEAFISASAKIGVVIDENKQRKVSRALREIMEGRPTLLSELTFLWRISRIIGLPWWRRPHLLLVSYFKLKRTAKQAPPVEGAIEAIEQLRKRPNVMIALVTSRSRKDAMSKIRSLGVLSCFDAIVTRDDVKSFKPSPEQVKLAAELLNLPVERCILVGDMPTDIDAAKSVGAVSVAVATGIFTDEAKSRRPDIIIGSLAELPSRLDEIISKMSR
ncbi:MAG: HAD family hydrolase [Candidatus Bathyarchaeia archaeon]